MKTNHPGWKPEPFNRIPLNMDDVDAMLKELRARAESHFQNYGDGIFMHPHEVVGCMFGQQLKLSAAADASIYTGDLKEFRERCVKTLFAILCGTMSVDKLTQARANASRE